SSARRCSASTARRSSKSSSSTSPTRWSSFPRPAPSERAAANEPEPDRRSRNRRRGSLMASTTTTQDRTGTDRDQETVREVLDEVRADGREALSAPEAKRVADAYGIPVPGEGLATSADEAVSLAEDMGYPVVAKIVSPDILHKTEAKGVLVGLKSGDEVRQGFDTIVQNAEAYKSDAKITGVQIQQMLPEGTEVLVGAIKDPSFGPVVTFGLGGILVEVLRDVTFRLAPVTNDVALEMVNGIRTAEILHGVRGRAGVDIPGLAN